MKESFWGYWIIVLGIFVIIIMMLISSVTTTNTQDYYLIKDVTEAAMIDAVDYSYYRQYQELRINREKFVENFLRRFAENVSLSTYTIDFYDIYEAPPKVSVKITTKSGTFSVMGDSTSFDIVNKVDSILENSGTAGSSGRGSNSNIKVDDDVLSGEGDRDYDEFPSNDPSNTQEKFTINLTTEDGDKRTLSVDRNKTLSQLNISVNHSRSGDWHCWLDVRSNDCFAENHAIREDLTLVETNMPPKSAITGFLVSEVSDDYYVCNYGNSPASSCKYGMKLKSEYANNRELLATRLLEHWQRYYHVEFTEQEKQTFLSRAR